MRRRDFGQVQFLGYKAHHETGEMVLGHEVLSGRRQKLRFVNLPGAKCLAHTQGKNLTRAPNASKIRYYPDGLLDHEIPANEADWNKSWAGRPGKSIVAALRSGGSPTTLHLSLARH